jgi:hypothetical protein
LVTVDEIPRGATPVAVRGLELGTHTVVISRPGYRPVERQVQLTAERPSRTLEVDLSPLPRTASASVATLTGSLVVDSRPGGAAVTIDGKPAGVTPLLLTVVAPGSHIVRIERVGYRSVTARVDVKAGQRARVAARLEGGQDEE